MPRFYIVAIEDGGVSSTDNPQVAHEFCSGGNYVVIDVSNNAVMQHDGPNIKIEEQDTYHFS